MYLKQLEQAKHTPVVHASRKQTARVSKSSIWISHGSEIPNGCSFGESVACFALPLDGSIE